MVRHADGALYSQELVNCDGNDPTIVATAKCTVPISALRAAPFYLNWGASVYATVVAGNVVGESATSTAGNGAVILTVPDAPINLQNVALVTNAQQVGLTWLAGVANGVSPVIDYRVNYDKGLGNGVHVELVSGITGTSFTATGLTRGVTYSFKIQARNKYGYSPASIAVVVLAA